MGGLQPGDAGVMAGLPDAAAPIGTHAECRAARGDKRGRPAAAAPWRPRQVVRIIRAAVQVVIRLAASAHFRHVRQAQHDRPFGPQPGHHRRVVVRHRPKRGTATRTRQPCHPHHVLDDHRQSVRGAQRLAAGPSIVGLVGEPQTHLGIRSFHQRVEAGIDRVDAVQVSLGDFRSTTRFRLTSNGPIREPVDSRCRSGRPMLVIYGCV